MADSVWCQHEPRRFWKKTLVSKRANVRDGTRRSVNAQIKKCQRRMGWEGICLCYSLQHPKKRKCFRHAGDRRFRSKTTQSGHLCGPSNSPGMRTRCHHKRLCQGHKQFDVGIRSPSQRFQGETLRDVFAHFERQELLGVQVELGGVTDLCSYWGRLICVGVVKPIEVSRRSPEAQVQYTVWIWTEGILRVSGTRRKSCHSCEVVRGKSGPISLQNQMALTQNACTWWVQWGVALQHADVLPFQYIDSVLIGTRLLLYTVPKNSGKQVLSNTVFCQISQHQNNHCNVKSAQKHRISIFPTLSLLLTKHLPVLLSFGLLRSLQQTRMFQFQWISGRLLLQPSPWSRCLPSFGSVGIQFIFTTLFSARSLCYHDVNHGLLLWSRRLLMAVRRFSFSNLDSWNLFSWPPICYTLKFAKNDPVQGASRTAGDHQRGLRQTSSRSAVARCRACRIPVRSLTLLLRFFSNWLISLMVNLMQIWSSDELVPWSQTAIFELCLWSGDVWFEQINMCVRRCTWVNTWVIWDVFRCVVMFLSDVFICTPSVVAQCLTRTLVMCIPGATPLTLYASATRYIRAHKTNMIHSCLAW